MLMPPIEMVELGMVTIAADSHVFFFNGSSMLKGTTMYILILVGNIPITHWIINILSGDVPILSYEISQVMDSDNPLLLLDRITYS
jgi:hypothetical protein